MMNDLLFRLRALLRRSHMDRELDAELRSHLEYETEKLIKRGLRPQEAARQARLALGGFDQVTEESRQARGVSLVETTIADVRYGLRMLRRSPIFTSVAVLTLALGFGANSAVFSVIYAVLLRPLPFPEPSRLVLVEPLGTKAGITNVTMPELQFWKEHNNSFISIAGHRGTAEQLLASGDKSIWVQTMPVTTDFFRTLGTRLALGQELQPENTRPGGRRAVVLTYGLWQRAFAGNLDVVGRGMTIDDASYTVAGVLPSDFWFPQPADVYVPLQFLGTADDLGTNTEMIGRLKPDVNLVQARAEMSMLSANYGSAQHETGNYPGLTVASYQDSLVDDVRLGLLLLYSAVALLFLMACFNLASLFLARLTARQKEIATRIALGCSHGRLARQFLIENFLLTTLGALVGLGATQVLLGTFAALIPFDLQLSAPVRIDPPVLAFTLIMALVVALAFSLAPATTGTRLDLLKTLRTGTTDSGISMWRRTRSVLVVTEIALTVTLLLGAGLTVRTLYQMHQEHLGFEPHGLMTFATPGMPQQRKNTVALRAFEMALLERLGTLREVSSAAGVSVLPLTTQNNFPTERDGHPDQSIGGMEIRIVTPSYFEAMRTPVVLGRPFNSGDIAGASPVILINETVARRWWGEDKPLGDRVVVGRMNGRPIGGSSDKPRVVVGIVADTKSVYLKAPPRPTVYLPAAQTPWYDSSLNWVVRGNFSAGFSGELLRMVAEIDPHRRIDRMRTMDEILSLTMVDSRFNAWLSGAFAVLALLLAAIGIYGLLAYMVTQRTREMGVRIALGAQRSDMFRLVMAQGLRLTLMGVGVGLIVAFASARLISSLLFGVSPYDPFTALMGSVLLMVTALLACYLPARRAMNASPIVALRCE